MSTLEAVLRFINIFSAGIAAGTFVMVLLALIGTVASLSPADGLRFHQRFDPRVDRYNPATVAVSFLTALALLFVGAGLRTTPGIATLLGLLADLGVGAISVGFNIPINRKISGWPLDPVPAEFTDLRQRWNSFHAVRTAFGLIAFTCFIVAGLAR